MGYLRYGDYRGSVEYDEEEECLYGRVQGMRDVSLKYKGKTVAELQKKFMNAVDKYIEKCHKKGEEPKRPYNGPLNVRLGPDLHFRAAQMAEKMEITINSLIKHAVSNFLKQYDGDC